MGIIYAMDIKTLNIGDTAKITGFKQGPSAYRSSLLSMGLLPGTDITVSRIAPLGDPIEIQLRGFSLILRKAEADILTLEKQP